MDKNILIIKGVTVIDGSGKEPISNCTVKICNDLICGISEGSNLLNEDESSKDTKVIDAYGKFLLPGLIDSHIHLHGYSLNDSTIVKLWHLTTAEPMKLLHAVNNARQLLENGFTTVRVMGDGYIAGSMDVHLRNAINKGIIPGPRILCSGQELSMTAGHGDLQIPVWSLCDGGPAPADGVEECIKAVRARVGEGVDFIKIHSSGGIMSEDKLSWRNYRVEEIKAICDEAHAFEKRVAAHAEGTEGIKIALKGGVDTIEHGIYLDDECIKMMLKRNVYLVPTLCVTEACLKQGEATGAPKSSIEKGRSAYKVHRESLQKAYKAGVKIALGSDAFNLTRVANNAIEFSQMALAGIPPLEVIKAGTHNAAEALGIADKVGTIEEGKLADLILMRKNPLDDISVIEDHSQILLVVKNGKVVVNRLKNKEV